MTYKWLYDIPDDWDQSSWSGWCIQWPDSPGFYRLLQNILYGLTRGRQWDEDTGTVTDAQQAGWAIWERNRPLAVCIGNGNGNGNGNGEVVEIVRIMSGGDALIGAIMSLCGYNPDAFKIEDGILYVRNFCGEWEAIGALGGGTALPDTPPLDPPPFAESSACAKALQLAAVTKAIVEAGFASVGIGDFIFGWYAFANYVKASVGLNLGDTELYNLFYFVYALDIAGLESETEDDDIRQAIACAMVDYFDDDVTGITSSQYADAKQAATFALKNWIGDSAYSGFGKTMRNAWERALASIGAMDASKITSNLVITGLEDCTCPDNAETIPTSSGWYLSTYAQVVATYDVDYNLKLSHKRIPEHDVYGIVFWPSWTGTPGNIKRMAAEAGEIGSFDVSGFADTSDHIEYEAQQTAWACGDDDAWDEVLGAGNYEYLTTGDIYNDVAVIGSPEVTAGQILAHAWWSDGDQARTITINYRLLHNTNSPSHA